MIHVGDYGLVLLHRSVLLNCVVPFGQEPFAFQVVQKDQQPRSQLNRAERHVLGRASGGVPVEWVLDHNGAIPSRVQ